MIGVDNEARRSRTKAPRKRMERGVAGRSMVESRETVAAPPVTKRSPSDHGDVDLECARRIVGNSTGTDLRIATEPARGDYVRGCDGGSTRWTER